MRFSVKLSKRFQMKLSIAKVGVDMGRGVQSKLIRTVQSLRAYLAFHPTP